MEKEKRFNATITVVQLAEILNEMVKENKGDYKVNTYDYDFESYVIDDICKYITLKM